MGLMQYFQGPNLSNANSPYANLGPDGKPQTYQQYQQNMAGQQAAWNNTNGAANAIGGYLSPNSNYNWGSYLNEAGWDPNLTQAQLLSGINPSQYGQMTGRPDWNMGQNLSAPDPAAFKAQYGYDIGNALKQYNPQNFQDQYGINLANTMQLPRQGYQGMQEAAQEANQMTTPGDFANYSGNPNWSLADQLKGFDSSNLQNNPAYQFNRDQGLQALDRSAAAHGGALGGGQQKAIEQYGQGLANTFYNDYFNQDQATKQRNLNEFNNYVAGDMNRKQANFANQANIFQGGLGMANQALGAYQGAQANDLANRQQALGQYNNWWDQQTQNQNRDLANYYGMNNLKNTLGQNALNAYQQNWNNYEAQRQNYGNYLTNLMNMGLGANQSTAGMLANQNQWMGDQWSGNASSQAQNNWNGAMGQTAAMNGMTNNLMGLGGMMAMRPGGYFSPQGLTANGAYTAAMGNANKPLGP